MSADILSLLQTKAPTFSKGQRQFNELAPYLMQSVNMDSKEASRLRVLIENTTKGYWVCPGHGPVFKNE